MKFFAYAQLVRLPNVFTAMADICLGAIVTGSILDQFGPFVFLLLASSFLYAAGMAWNDYFDFEQDLRERPQRPLPSGRITRGSAARLGAALMIVGVGLAWLADSFDDREPYQYRSLGIALGLVAAIFAYDGWLKRTALGPWSMAACRFLNVLLGLSTAASDIPVWGYLLALTVFFYIAGVTWFAKTEARLSNQSMLSYAAMTMLGGLVLAVAVPAAAQELSFAPASSPLFPYLLALFGFFLAARVVPAIRRPDPARVQPAVKRAVLGLVMFDAILASSLVGVVGLLIALFLVPAYFLGRWMYST
jgi:4-hydroxybenzoate polyprenyltransferase